jgi:formate dehydrogenase maturation protein FdhE
MTELGWHLHSWQEQMGRILAEIRRQEREKVLEMLDELRKYEEFDGRSGNIRTQSLIKSLRQQEGEP